MTNSKNPFREIATIVALSVFLSFIHNSFSSKGLPLIRKEIEKVAVSDSALFGVTDSTRKTPRQDTHDHPDVKVPAPAQEKPQVEANPGVPAKKKESYRIISLDQMRRLLSDGHNILFDARDAEAYRKGHIRGARNVSGLEAEDHFEEFVTIPRDTLILIYCNNPDCHLGRMLADFMGAIGFTNLLLYDEGWDGWEKAKMPVDTTSATGGRK